VMRNRIRRWARQAAPQALITWRLFRGLGSLRAKLIFAKRTVTRRFKAQPDQLPPRLERGSEIAIVCWGNIMRSALAEAVVRAGLRQDTVKVVSAGINATPGTPADLRAAAFAETRGLSLGDHRARPLDPSLLRRADLIIALDRGIEAEILAREPGARSRVVLLGGLDPSGSYRGMDILDPVLASPEEAELVFHAVETGAGSLASWVNGAGSR